MKFINQNKMTAVEWLVDQMRQRKEQGLTLSFYDLEMFASYAKTMEKENIKQTWQESRKIKSVCSNWNCIGDEKVQIDPNKVIKVEPKLIRENFRTLKKGEQYYNETFKSE